MIAALLVGSRKTWRRQVDPLLLAHGIEVRWWWPTTSQSESEPPKHCQVIVVMTDCCSHKLSKPAMEMARKFEVPLICGNHRKSSMSQVLERAGFPVLTSALAMPQAPIDIVGAALATLPASTILDLPPLLPSEPETEPTPEPSMPFPLPTPTGLSVPERRAYESICLAICSDPNVANNDLANSLGLAPGSIGTLTAKARRNLGLRFIPGPVRRFNIDHAVYDDACAKLGVRPAPTPTPTPSAEKPSELERLGAAARKHYDAALPLVAGNPWLTAAEVSEKTGIPSNVLFRPLRLAREACGIRAGQGSGANSIVDRARYEAACREMGMTPIEEDVGPTRPPGTAHLRSGGDRASPGRGLAESEPVAPTLPPSWTEAMESKPTGGKALLPGEAAKDTVEALRLLLEAMRAEGVEQVTVSDDGKVHIRRRIVIASSLTL